MDTWRSLFGVGWRARAIPLSFEKRARESREIGLPGLVKQDSPFQLPPTVSSCWKKRTNAVFPAGIFSFGSKLKLSVLRPAPERRLSRSTATAADGVQTQKKKKRQNHHVFITGPTLTMQK